MTCTADAEPGVKAVQNLQVLFIAQGPLNCTTAVKASYLLCISRVCTNIEGMAELYKFVFDSLQM